MELSIDRKTLLNSINIALLFSANALTWVLMLDNSIVAIMAICAVIFVAVNKSLFKPRVLPLIAFLLTCFLVSFLTSSGNIALHKYFIEFLMFGCVSLFLSQTRFDINTIITSLCFISIPLVPFIIRIDLLGGADYGQWMGISYGSLKFILALFYAILFIPYKQRWIKFVYSGALLYYVYLFLTIASRGAVLGIFVFFVLSYLIKRDYSLQKSLVIIAIASVVLYVFFIPIIEFILGLLGGNRLDFYALEKIVYYSAVGRLDNGRILRVEDGLRMFTSSPLLGNGIAAFERQYQIGYVHNLFVQQLLEGGLVLFLPLTAILLVSMYLILSNRIAPTIRLFVSYLFCCNVVGLLFSDYYWRNQGYWFLIGYSLFLLKLLKRTKHG